MGERAVALGDGDVDVAGCLRLLIAYGYQGAVSLETEGDGEPESRVSPLALAMNLLERAKARQAEEAARVEAEQHKKKLKATLATQRAGYGYGGVRMEGSPLLVQMETEAEGLKDLENILKKGGLAAEGYRYKGEQAETAGYYGAGSSLLTGGSSVLSGLYKGGYLGK